LLYRLTLPEILAGGVSCPAIPTGYRTDHAAIAEDGYDFGEFFIDARVDLATCDATSLPVARMGCRSVLQWWIDRCTGDYAAIGSTISVQYPGEALHYVRLTRSLVDKGCGDLGKARQIVAED
jgi:hypothetical protein